MDEPPIDTGVEPESSIIIIACRRFAPAPMAIGVSGKGCDVGGCDSEIRLNGGTWEADGLGGSPFVVDGLDFVGRWVGRRVVVVEGGEGDERSEGSGMDRAVGECGVGRDDGLGRSVEALVPEVVAFLASGFAARFVVGAEVGVAVGRIRSLSFSFSSSSSSSSSLALMASNLASVQSITLPIVIPPPSISSDGPVTPPAETPCWMKLSIS